MTSPLDEISFKLGEVSTHLTIITSRLDRQDRELTNIQTNVGEVKTRMKPMAEDVKWMAPQVRHYQGIRKRAALVGGGILSVAGVIGGAIVQPLFEWFTNKFGA